MTRSGRIYFPNGDYSDPPYGFSDFGTSHRPQSSQSGRIAGCPSAGGQRSDAVNPDVARAVRGTGNTEQTSGTSPSADALGSMGGGQA